MVNTIILTLFTLFPCYCYKFKMKERHKFTLFLFKHAKIIVICSFGIIKQLLPSYEVNIQIVYPRRVVFRIKYFEFEICTVQHIFNNVNTTICFVLLIIYNCCLHTRWTFILLTWGGLSSRGLCPREDNPREHYNSDFVHFISLLLLQV
jgi:hypothetical protein